MNWQEIFSLQNLQNIATICGTIIFTVYMSFRTFKTKLDKAMSENKTDVPKEIEKQSELDCAIMAEAEKLKESGQNIQIISENVFYDMLEM